MAGESLGISKTDKHFLLGCLSLAGSVPFRGDMITDAFGVNWTIIIANLFSFGNTPIYYDCIARPQQ
jgi:hypothetical protein